VAAISAQAALKLAAQLDLDVDEVGICHACLSFVSFPLRAGDEPETRRATNEFAPILWDEGLEAPVREALERARAAGVTYADAAIRVSRRGRPQHRRESDRPEARRRPLGAVAGKSSSNGVQAMAAR
jgi:hypothetical protein